MAEKVKPKKKLILFLIAAQQYLRTIYIRAKIINTQQYSEYRLCDEWVQMVYYIINECNKLIQKTKYD